MNDAWATLVVFLLIFPVLGPTAESSAREEVDALWDFSSTPEMLDKVTPDALNSTILDLQNFETRYCLADNNSLATEYIRERFSRVELQTELFEFEWVGEKLYNVIGTLPGTHTANNDVYIACGHFDSISPEKMTLAPGANDNGSGTAAVLLMAEIMAQYQWNATIRFITFNAEEVGLYGSKYYTMDLWEKGENVTGAYNLDMVAYNGNDTNLSVAYTNESEIEGVNSTWMLDSIRKANNDYELGLNVLAHLRGISHSVSDHHPFWNRYYDAVLVIEKIDPDYPYYHSVNDTLDNLNTTYASLVTKAVMGAIADDAGINSTDVRGPSHSFKEPNPGSFQLNPVNISLQVTDPNGLNHSSIHLYVNGVETAFDHSDVLWGWNVFTGPKNYGNDSHNTIRITAKDTYGNPLDFTWNFTVDSTPPPTIQGMNISAEDNDVNISWTVEDDPDIDHFNIYTSTTCGDFDYGTVSATTNESYYVDVNAAITLGSKFYSVRAVDKAGNTDENILIMGKTSNNLYNGWTLVSNNYVSDDYSVRRMLQRLEGDWQEVQTYSAQTENWSFFHENGPPWLNSLTKIDLSTAFWIKCNKTSLRFCNHGLPPHNVSIQLKKGWNLVGYPYYSGKSVEAALAGLPWDAVFEYDYFSEYKLIQMDASNYMNPGEGYWIHLSSDAVWECEIY